MKVLNLLTGHQTTRKRNFYSKFRHQLGNSVLCCMTVLRIEQKMSEEIREGENEKSRGKIREEVGKLTGDKSEQAKGKLDQVKGEVKKDLGKASDAV